MGFKCGIVGLPNVGKSTIFNCLSAAKAEAANYPFCTIEPNVGKVPVPDERLKKLEALVKPQRTLSTITEFVDIAGLVKGASEGQGLGNKFLAHIREVQVIVHVVRCFENSDIVHVEGSVDPVRDVEIIETELMLSDLESIEKRFERIQKLVRAGDKKAAFELSVMELVKKALEAGKWLSREKWDAATQDMILTFNLLSTKPVLFVANVTDPKNPGPHYEKLKEFTARIQSPTMALCGRLEEEILDIPEAERDEFLKEMGLEESGLNRMIREAYGLLGLITYFTAGEKEVRAWTIQKGWKAPQAAGVIHTDFERGFICADTCSYDDFIRLGSEAKVRAAGMLRQEGKEYIVKDGDILHFKFNV